MNTDTQEEDQMLLISQYYAELYATHDEQAPQQAEGGKRRRRRRKKSKDDEASGNNGGGGGKRKLSPEQANFLEINFGSEHKLESERKERLASELGLDPRQVAVWFQNRRARWKSKKMEEEYSRLKAEHDSNVLDNYRLQTEVLRLKEQLTETEKELQMLMEKCDINSSNSPISSLSIEATGPPNLFDEFGIGGIENIFNMPGNNNYIQGMDWANMYI